MHNPAGTPQADASEADLAKLAEDLRRAVGKFVRAVRDDAGTAKSAQSETLGLLDRSGAMNVAALAQARKVKHQTMRLVVAQLEASALLESSPDPGDGRSRLLSISAAGRAELMRQRQARTARIEQLIRSLSDKERDALRTSVALLDRMAAAGA